MNKVLIITVVLLIAVTAYAFRATHPFILKYPVDQEQISQLNKFLEEIWLMQNGRSELDIVTAVKTNARNGEMWMIQTGSVVRLQWKANNIIWTTP